MIDLNNILYGIACKGYIYLTFKGYREVITEMNKYVSFLSI